MERNFFGVGLEKEKTIGERKNQRKSDVSKKVQKNKLIFKRGKIKLALRGGLLTQNSKTGLRLNLRKRMKRWRNRMMRRIRVKKCSLEFGGRFYLILEFKKKNDNLEVGFYLILEFKKK